MNILDSAGSASRSAAVQQLAQQFGLPPAQAEAAIGALLPAVTTGLKQNADANEAGLAAALAAGHHQQYLDRPETLTRPETAADGNAILGHIFGSKEVSRQVAADAAQRSGVDSAILKKMLPIVAALAMGALSRQSRGSGAGIPGAAAATWGLGGLLGSLLDRDRDGSAIDDVTGMLGGMLRRKQ